MLFVLVPPVQKVLQRFSKFCFIWPNFFDLDFSTRLAHLLSFAGLFLFVVMFFFSWQMTLPICQMECHVWQIWLSVCPARWPVPVKVSLIRSWTDWLKDCFSLLAKMVDWLVERLWCSGLICQEMKGGLCQTASKGGLSQLVAWDFTRDRGQVKVWEEMPIHSPKIWIRAVFGSNLKLRSRQSNVCTRINKNTSADIF